MYKSNIYEDWVVKGWYEIIPFDKFSHDFAGTKNRKVYYYAECTECGSTWGDGDATGYVPTDGNSFTNFDSECIGKVRNFSEAYIGNKDLEISLTGY